MLDIISISVGLIALIPFFTYFLHWKFYSPKPLIRVSGEQTGDPIHIPKKGNIFFSVSTKSSHRSILSEVWASFDSEELDIFQTKGAEQRITADNRFPLALLFTGRKIFVKGHFQGYFFDFEAKKPEFSVKFICHSEIEASELPFLLNMFPARKIRTEQVVKFKVIQNYVANLPKDGLALLPKESLHIEGVQSQGAMSAATSKGIGRLKIREIIDDKKSQ